MKGALFLLGILFVARWSGSGAASSRRRSPSPWVLIGKVGVAVPLGLLLYALAVREAFRRTKRGRARGAQGNPQGLRDRRDPPAHRPAGQERRAPPRRARRGDPHRDGGRQRRPRRARRAEDARAARHAAGPREIITKEKLEYALDLQKRSLRRLGDILVEVGFVSKDDLQEMTALQTTETVYRLFHWKSGTYEFVPGDVEWDGESVTPLRAESVLMEGFRQVDEWPMVRRKICSTAMTFERLQDARARAGRRPPRDEASADEVDAAFEGLGEKKKGGEFASLGENERRAYELAVPGRTVEKIVDLSRLGEFETCKSLLDAREPRLPARRSRPRRPGRGGGRRLRARLASADPPRHPRVAATRRDRGRARVDRLLGGPTRARGVGRRVRGRQRGPAVRRPLPAPAARAARSRSSGSRAASTRSGSTRSSRRGSRPRAISGTRGSSRTTTGGRRRGGTSSCRPVEWSPPPCRGAPPVIGAGDDRAGLGPERCRAPEDGAARVPRQRAGARALRRPQREPQDRSSAGSACSSGCAGGQIVVAAPDEARLRAGRGAAPRALRPGRRRLPAPPRGRRPGDEAGRAGGADQGDLRRHGLRLGAPPDRHAEGARAEALHQGDPRRRHRLRDRARRAPGRPTWRWRWRSPSSSSGR